MNRGTNDGDMDESGDPTSEIRTLADVNAAGPWADQWAATDTAIQVLDAVRQRRTPAPAGMLTSAGVRLRDDGRVELIEPSTDERHGETASRRGAAPTGPRDDVAAVGALLYEMLAGQAPSGVDAQSALRLRSDVDPRLAAVVAKALAPERAARFESTAALRSALDALRVSLSGATEMRRVTIDPSGATSAGAAAAPPTLVRRSRWPAILTVLSLLVAAALAFALLSDRKDTATTARDSVSVPNLAGMPSAQAQQTLQAAGLTSKLLQEPSVAVPQGNVIRSSPAAGTQVTKGSQVIVVVSGQAAPGTVPSLVGLGQSEAQSILSQFGLTATFQQEASSAPAGTVIRQSPDPGATTAAGSSVTLTVSSGPAPATTTGTGSTTTTTTTTTNTTTGATNVQVPSLVGQTYETASSMLAQSGLNLGSITYQTSVQTPGTVISQNPPAGATVAEASSVSVVVAE